VTLATESDAWWKTSSTQLGSGTDTYKQRPLGKLLVPAAKEVVELAKALETEPCRQKVSALLGDSAYWNVYPMRTASSLLFAESPAHTVAFFAGLVPFAEDPDSGAIFAAAWDGGGIASLLFNDGSGDFFVAARSIRALMKGPALPDRATRPKDTAKLEQRYRQHIWIAQIMFDAEQWYIADDDVVSSVAYARPLAAYKRDRATFATSPDLAASWILAHAIAGRSDAVADAITASKAQKHPAVRELATKLANPNAMDKLLAKRDVDLPAIRAALAARGRTR
jgi:hypothetical protein